MRARLVAGVLLLALLPAGSAAAASEPTASARAFGVRVTVPGGGGATAGAVASPPQAAGSLTGWTHDSGAVTVGAVSTRSRTAVAGGRAVAEAQTAVESVTLFGGEVSVRTVDLRVLVRASGSGSAGRLSPSALAGVTVLGKPVSPAVNGRLPLGDWGYVVFLEQAVVRASAGQTGRRTFATGLHVHLTADHGGLPAGSEILVGYAEAAASAPRAAQPSPPVAASPPAAPPRRPQEPVPPPPGAPQPSPPVESPPAGVKPELTAGGYVFPVYGPASFTDDFRASRALTGWHHGNDIFAEVGAPVLAVTGGTLFLVGWNDVGGNRLWLRDDQGNEFYYAHLSAYSPLAVDGARVRAGDVLGFVGATGDAVGTPPHLHFEIHPFGLLWMGYDGVVNPYAYLLAWRRLQDASFDPGSWAPPAGRARAPGAVLLQADDVSAVSGLDAEGFSELMAVPDIFGEGLPGPEIVEAEPGFG